MQLQRFAHVLLALLLAPPTATQPPVPDLAGRVDAVFAEYARPDRPGGAIAVVRDGELIFAKGYGRASLEHDLPITPDTTFNLGSTSKQFTAFAALLLEQRGKLDLAAEVRRYVPELSASTPAIRVRDLLLHSSGLRDEGTLARLVGRRPTTTAAVLELLSRQRGLNFAPGSRHEYSHSDFTVLGAVVERVTGEPLGEFLRREVWAPLGMTSTVLYDGRRPIVPGRALAHVATATSFAVRFPDDEVTGGDNVFSSVADLARWERNLHSGGHGGALVARMVALPTLASGQRTPYAHGLRHGSWRGLRTISRSSSGGGFPSEQLRFPDHGLAIYTLLNVSPSHPRYLSQDVAALLLGDQLAAPVAAALPAPAPADELALYVGWYKPVDAPWNLVRLVAKDGLLYEELQIDRPDRLLPLSRLAPGRYSCPARTVYVLTPGDGPRPRTLTLETVDGPEPMLGAAWGEFWQPDAAQLEVYAGSYYSDELAVMWRMHVHEGALVVRRDGLAGEHRFQAIERDLFRGDCGTTGDPLPAGLQFRCDAAGAGQGFALSAIPDPYEVVRGVQFARMPR